MVEVSYPPRRTIAGHRHDQRFIEVLEAMLSEDETVTARAVARKLEGVDHASSITRDAWRKERLAEWQARQRSIRALASRAGKQSKAKVAADLARKEERIRELEAQIEMLLASHRAMIRAVGEMGGMKAWMRLFSLSQPALEKLKQLGALPNPIGVLADVKQTAPQSKKNTPPL